MDPRRVLPGDSINFNFVLRQVINIPLVGNVEWNIQTDPEREIDADD